VEAKGKPDEQKNPSRHWLHVNQMKSAMAMAAEEAVNVLTHHQTDGADQETEIAIENEIATEIVIDDTE
jgi:hypothetical protein